MQRHLIWFLIASATAPAVSADTGADESKRDEASLRAVEDHWNRAEGDGDSAYVSKLLAPEYRSISATGETTTRAALLDRLAKRNTDAARAAARKEMQTYFAKHPTEMTVVIHGTLGVVSFYNPKRGDDHSVRGADVFVFEDNHWHAVYSLHNAAD